MAYVYFITHDEHIADYRDSGLPPPAGLVSGYQDRHRSSVRRDRRSLRKRRCGGYSKSTHARSLQCGPEPLPFPVKPRRGW